MLFPQILYYPSSFQNTDGISFTFSSTSSSFSRFLFSYPILQNMNFRNIAVENSLRLQLLDQMEENYNDKTLYGLALEFDDVNYQKKIGAYKPKFIGIPEDYFPLSWVQGILYALIVVLTIGSVLGIMIGFIFWITKNGLDGFAAIWSAIFLLFILIMIPAFYIGGKNRIKEEKRLIVQAQKRQEEMKGEKGTKGIKKG